LILAVFGASGETGQHVIARARSQGLEVRALVRRGSRFDMSPENLTVIRGAFEDDAALQATLADADAACCVFGPRPPYRDIFCAAATKAVLDAMQRSNARRLICQTGAMIGHYPHNRSWPFKAMRFIAKHRMRRVMRDRRKQETLVRSSDLDWTIVKPPRLTDTPPSGDWIANPQVRIGLLDSISRADLAEFIVTEILTPAHIKEAVFIRQ
jgi:putative NADH-flavin reductase